MNVIRRFWRWLTRNTVCSVVFTDAFRSLTSSVMGRDNLLVYGDPFWRRRGPHNRTDMRGYQSLRSIAACAPYMGQRRVVVAVKLRVSPGPAEAWALGPARKRQSNELTRRI